MPPDLHILFPGKRAVLTNSGRTQAWCFKCKAAAIETSATAVQHRSLQELQGEPVIAWGKSYTRDLQPACSPWLHQGSAKELLLSSELEDSTVGSHKDIIHSPLACGEASKAAGDPETRSLQGEGSVPQYLCLLPLLQGWQWCQAPAPGPGASYAFE